MDAENQTGRRQFLRALAVALGAPIVFRRQLTGFPYALTQEAVNRGNIPRTKQLLTLLSDVPFNAETPAHLLDDDVTPNHLHFVRNNGHFPDRALLNQLGNWRLTLDGEVNRPRTWTLNELQNEFEVLETQLVIECAGNGRAGYYPQVSGNQWTLGAVGCARYRGIRLADVLNTSGVLNSAVYLAWHGEDPHLSRDPERHPISRGVPIAKALDRHTLLVWEMNGVPLPPSHGFPLRLVCPGWPGSTSGKWLRRLWVRDRVHDGAKMTGSSYRVPRNPVAPGQKVAEEDMEIIDVMPVKSLITFPQTGTTVPEGELLELRGKAWSGTGPVARVDLSIDFGASWLKTQLLPPPNPYAWQKWNASVPLPSAGYYEVWARATDARGRAQPLIVPGWNPKGYLNNAMHRIVVRSG